MSTPQESLVERMQARGLRLTHQRRVLAELLESSEEHLDAEAIYQLARRKDPQIHRATIYRTLKTLKKLGLIDELDLMHASGDRHYYEIRPSVFHFHLVCMRCGSVSEPSGEFWEAVRVRVQNETGFKPEMVRLEVGGQCRACQARAPESRNADDS